jgi:hypothetical protein
VTKSVTTCAIGVCAAAEDRLHFQVFVKEEYLGDVVMGPGDTLVDVRCSVTLHLEGVGSCPLTYTFRQPGEAMSRVRKVLVY